MGVAERKDKRELNVDFTLFQKARPYGLKRTSGRGSARAQGAKCLLNLSDFFDRFGTLSNMVAGDERR